MSHWTCVYKYSKFIKWYKTNLEGIQDKIPESVVLAKQYFLFYSYLASLLGLDGFLIVIFLFDNLGMCVPEATLSALRKPS